jgi:hypothetical protein
MNRWILAALTIPLSFGMGLITFMLWFPLLQLRIRTPGMIAWQTFGHPNGLNSLGDMCHDVDRRFAVLVSLDMANLLDTPYPAKKVAGIANKNHLPAGTKSKSTSNLRVVVSR